MATTTQRPRPALREFLISSGEPRPRTSRRTDVITTLLSIWFVLGLFMDAWAHANIPRLETFFTPWHAVFYSGFAATATWILWTVWLEVRQGRRGLAAVPVGYGLTVVALPVFAVAGFFDYLWHTYLGIERTIDIFFSPSHLALITSMVLILTSPLRSAWVDETMPPTPSLRRLLPAVLTTAFATTLVLLFLDYGNAIRFRATAIVTALSTLHGGAGLLTANTLAVCMVVTNLVLMAPLLLLARKWRIPFGTATIVYTAAATISGALSGLRNVSTLLTIVAAGICVDMLARWLRPEGSRRTAYWAFSALAPLVTWTLYIVVASISVGHTPAVAALWTGAPIVAALVGWLLGVLLLPSVIVPATRADPS